MLTRKNPLSTVLLAVHYVNWLEAQKVTALAGRGSLLSVLKLTGELES